MPWTKIYQRGMFEMSCSCIYFTVIARMSWIKTSRKPYRKVPTTGPKKQENVIYGYISPCKDVTWQKLCINVTFLAAQS